MRKQWRKGCAEGFFASKGLKQNKKHSSACSQLAQQCSGRLGKPAAQCLLMLAGKGMYTGLYLEHGWPL